MKKLNIKKVGLTLSLVSAISVCSVFTALANWKQNETGWWYEEENGNYIKTDWKLINGKWYYFGEDGYLYTNKVTPDGYKVDKNGEITEKLEETEIEDDKSLEETIPVVEETTELEIEETESEVHTFEETTVIESSETQTTEIETTVPESTTVVEIPETKTTVAETTPEVTEAPTTTVPETTTVASTEAPTTVPETTPKSTEWQSTGSWNNENEARAIGKEIQETNGWDINPIRIESNSASYGASNSAISISKNGNGYDLTLYVRVTNNATKQGLKALCMLTGISGLYDTIYDAYEGSNSSGINYDAPVTIGGHSYIATNNGSNMVFHIQ